MKTAVVDFDGTIVSHEFPDIGALKPGAKEALNRLHDDGWEIIISSCRNSCDFPARARTHYLKDMEEFLRDNGIPFDLIDDGSLGKPIADVYIDDKGIRFENNWSEIAARLLKGDDGLSWGQDQPDDLTLADVGMEESQPDKKSPEGNGS